MARLSYDSVEALIYDPVSANRTATRAALYSLGFRRTEFLDREQLNARYFNHRTDGLRVRGGLGHLMAAWR